MRVAARPGFGVRLAAAEVLLAEFSPAAVVEREWPLGPVRLSAYIGACDLPTEIPGRVRCLVADGDRVLMTRDRGGYPDCFPGGGAEPGETLAETAHREVWEETGWHIATDSIEPIGWIHLESLSDWTDDHPFPHPDVFMAVVTASLSHAGSEPHGWVDTDGFVLSSAFVSIRELPEEIWDDPISAAFLEHVFGARGSV